MKTPILLGCATAALVYSTLASAVGAPVQHQFSNGSVADADQVNANFQELADRISEIPAGPPGADAEIPSYDYADFSNTYSSKTYSVTGTGSHNREVHTFDRTTEAPVIIMQEERFDGATRVRYRRLRYLPTATAYSLASIETYTQTGPDTWELSSTRTMDPPLVLLRSDMTEGGTSTSSTRFVDTDDLGAVISDNRHAVESVNTEGLDDVSVPYGAQTACLKLSRLRSEVSPGGFHRVEWRCPNLGLVKRVHVNGSGTHEMTLQSVTP